MKLYRFSPINSEIELRDAITHVAQEAAKLFYETTGETCEIEYITIFSHYPNEFDKLKQIIEPLGEVRPGNNGWVVELKEPIQLPHNQLHLLRIRHPDPYRMQVGCCDFKIPNYESFKEKFLNKKDGMRTIEREDYEMIEIFNPDYDTLAYVTNKALS